MCGEPAAVKVSFVNGRIVYQQEQDAQYSYLVEEVRKLFTELNQRMVSLES